MDLATLLGLIGAFGVIIAAILTGGSSGTFINAPSILIVMGGTAAATLMRYSFGEIIGSLRVGMKAFFHKPEQPKGLIEAGVELATVARKEGMLGLEKQEVSNEFLKKGIQLCVDGHEPDFVRNMLNKDINLTIERHDVGQGIFKSIGDVAPAMGMIGTLVGLVQMLASMDDPKMIGPAMAIALLTTLYGAIIANAFALPIADKLAHRSKEERCNKKLILETVGAIQQGLNPRVMEELLKTYLPGNQREDKGKEAA